jgi:tetratricopeptide (TPR) repeat protein
MHITRPAIEIEPSYINASNNKGILLNDLGKYEQAIQYFNKAIEIGEGNGKAWNNKGISFYSLSKYEQAIKCYDKASVSPAPHN